MMTMMQRRGLVSLHGEVKSLSTASFRPSEMLASVPPPDPSTLLLEGDADALLQKHVDALAEWWDDKQQVLCLTGAGLSTESGIPDYRGSNGSYHRGHKPMMHQQFMSSESQRKRYWGRGMVGWRFFDQRQPNTGHYALAELERMGKLGVCFEDHPTFYGDEDDYFFTTGQRQLSLVTQNVDSLHRRAGSQHMVELHGRTGDLKCMQCGSTRLRSSFHEELESLNRDWLEAALNKTQASDMRADGDAEVLSDYDSLLIPPCTACGDGFLKPDVVFFGDTVPTHRVALCTAAVNACDGLFVVGSSLAVHSAFRHVRAASVRGVPIAILNVGDTRAEVEGLPGVLKIEAPAGWTLSALVSQFDNHR
jgi:NAD-dependent deacetylase sirtuin 4